MQYDNKINIKVITYLLNPSFFHGSHFKLVPMAYGVNLQSMSLTSQCVEKSAILQRAPAKCFTTKKSEGLRIKRKLSIFTKNSNSCFFLSNISDSPQLDGSDHGQNNKGPFFNFFMDRSKRPFTSFLTNKQGAMAPCCNLALCYHGND